MYNPELESRRKDYCQAKRCKEPSDIIVQGKGYCDYHYEELFRLNETVNDQPCECPDCSAPVASFQEHKVGSTYEQRSTLTLAELNKPEKVKKKEIPLANIEAYKEATGKRFRMTKDQKSRGLSRGQAFKEFIS
tara:strand:- start:71 stop:472 length:402 start_codon:yes stop_codon:yes gene_type:complete